MSAGTHVIEVSAYRDGANRLSSAKSWPIRVQLAASTRSVAATPSDTSWVTTDGVRLHARVVAGGLEDPTGLLALPDGRVLVAELAGRVRVLRGGALVPSPALMLTEAATGPDRGLLAMVADPDFAKTRALFLLYTTTSGLRLARFSEANDILSNRAILLDGLPIAASRPSATLTIGADNNLYVALDNGGDGSSQGDLGTFSGKVLRLTKDGTTPADDAAATPIYATGLGRPTGMSWGDGGTLWLAGNDAEGPNQLQSHAGGAVRGGRVQRYTLPAGVSASSLSIYRSAAIPAFSGNLFIADAASGSILRLRVDSTGSPVETEWLLHGQLNGVKAVTVAGDGSLYVALPDSIVRIAPDGLR